ncbi:RNA cap guanine-N2 methyltransferase-domain-containing protein [Lyophyllum atratum]|nr:RNA cap guanine-N2 methyltransferase-domain-containing protein [Lyophyllum atratum]
MGKRRGGLSGLASFVRHALKEEPPSATTAGPKTPLEDAGPEDRPAKRQKITTTTREGAEEWIEKWVAKYDATGLVPHYTHAAEVPEQLKKYFSQRKRYFSLYSTTPGCLLDEEGWYSVTPELVANQIAERCRSDTILDAFCGVGGNAIAFAKTCQRVIALDTSPTRLALARHNAQVYGVADRIEFILSDYLSFARTYLALPHTQTKRNIDVVFLSPPWGGPSYLSGTPTESEPISEAIASGGKETTVEEHPSYSLSSIQPIHGAELFRLTRQITPNVAYFLPRNTRLDEISNLLEDPADPEAGSGVSKEGGLEHVEVEEEWMGSKLKALTCYFGGLVAGQEALF